MNFLLAGLLLLLISGQAWPLDQKDLLDHIRESYQIPYHVPLVLDEKRASEIPGFWRADLRIGPGVDPQIETVYISTDGRHYLLGGFKDVSIHPDRERLRKVDLARSASRGSRNAPVTVVEYTDFQCPFCKKGYDMMRRLLSEFGSRVRWVYKAMPLETIHPWAETAAVAAECAGLEGEEKFWKVHDLFFDHQREVSNANLESKVKEFAKTAGVALPRFETCLSKRETRGRVRKDLAEAAALGINGAPAFLVNGHLVSGADYDALKLTVQESLEGMHGGH